MPGGRPPKFETPEELMRKFEEYMIDDPKNDYKNLSGFCVYADTHRGYLAEIEQDKPEFSCAIKKIRDGISQYCIKHAQKSEKNQALNIFLLKNYGYTDKSEQDINIKGSISLDSLLSDAEDDDK